MHLHIRTSFIYILFVIFVYKVAVMTNVQLYSQISSLSSDLKQEVSDFIESLKQNKNGGKKINERQFGYAKDFFKIANDFDEPLADFEEYS